MNNTIKYNS